ncbi:MAG: response regulator, partial [Gammaproteobacteria bacterium]|nr:response regulator [Gammaproteobacteria bacterium]
MATRNDPNQSGKTKKTEKTRKAEKVGKPGKPGKRNRKNPEAEALRGRISNLSAAILRISASLDVDTVLQEVVDSARALTGARYGLIATIDGAGRPQEFVISGLPPEEARQAAAWTDAPRLFEHLRGLDGPLRLADLGEYVRSIGLAPGLIPCRTFQGTPMRHRGLDVGNFFLGEKEGGGEFTDGDEEVLVLFAAQAAIAIANARAHRDERRARADLEALVETSPVGVAVLDADAGDPLSLNREANRLLGGLLGPDRPLEDLRGVLTARLSDGREVTLGDLRNAETLRTVEIELSVPGGRSLRLLVNATPIRPAGGEVESVVVTMQDLAPLEELDRLRAEFISMVSHELRAPLTSIKGSTTTLLGTSRTLDRAETRQFIRIIDAQADHMEGLIGDLLDAGRIDSGTLSVDPEPLGVAALVEQARTTFLAGGGRQAVQVDLPPDLPRVLADERRIVQVLNNLLANAARHSPESSPIHVDASCDGAEVAVSVADGGRGMVPERLVHLFRRYADAAHGREPEGFGLGLVICKGLVEAHGGRIRAESAGPGLGTRFTFTLPLATEAAAGSAAEAGRPSGGPGEPGPVLVVDDDPQMLRYVRDALAAAGYTPLVTGDPEEVAALIHGKRPRLVLLDLMLPGTDGVELMETVPGLADLPVIFISAYGRDETIARALESGGADYIVKPFSPTELAARVRAVLRRRADPETFVLDDLVIDYGRRLVTVAGRPVRLTPIEFELLRVLSLNPGRVMTHAALLRQVWGSGNGGNNSSLRDFVKKIRRKLGDDPA